MKKILLFILIVSINNLYSRITNFEVIIKLDNHNSNLVYLKKIFPKDSIELNTNMLQTWKISFKDSIPYYYLNCLKESNQIINYLVNKSLSTRSTIPNDPYFVNQPYHSNKINLGFSIPYGINTIDAWDFKKKITNANGDTIVVAICDFGFDINHEDLDFFTNYNEIPNDSIDNDNNGAIDDFKGWNIAQNNSNTNGTGNGHGTPACGRIAAIGNNNKGVCGVAWNCKLLPIAEVTSVDLALKSFEYIYNMKRIYIDSKGKKGAYIVAINFSLGKRGRDIEDDIWCQMFDSMGSVGIITTVAVDNLNQNVESYQDMPVLCNSPYMINVTACDTVLIGLNGSAYSKKYVHLAAHNSYYSTFPGNSYYNVTPGASFSAPLVAGTIALMYSNFDKVFLDTLIKNPKIMTLKIKDIILKQVDVSPNLLNKVLTNGKLNVFKTIKIALTLKDSLPKPYLCLNKTVKIVNSSTLEAIQDTVNYQWYRCNPWQKITNETKKTFTTSTRGSYAVIVSNGVCTDTSDCVALYSQSSSLGKGNPNTGISIYPNPAKDKLNIDFDQFYPSTKLRIYDMLGKLMYSADYKQIDKLQIEVDKFPIGIYSLHLAQDNEIHNFKFVKE
jgi:hypothetical protein